MADSDLQLHPVDIATSDNRAHSLRAKELMQERKEALKEAGRAWQSGRRNNHGGEVAFYYAEKV